jgi:M6 family metalloprotease-like protein
MKKSALILSVFLFLVAVPLSAMRPPKTGAIPPHLRPFFMEMQKEYEEGYWAEHMRERQRTRSTTGESFSLSAAKIDTANVPVLLGKYSDAGSKYSVEAFQALLFDGPNATGTVTQYYLQNSYGQFFMTGKALGWYAVPRTFNYYVHDGTSGSKTNVGLAYGGKDFVIDLIVMADPIVDFSKFAKYEDAEGWHVPQLGIVHTGSDAATGGDNIWSHRSSIRSRLTTRKNDANETIITDKSRILSNGHYRTNDSLNGKPVIIDGDYAIQPEMLGSSNSSGNMVEIGVFAHEFGHIFGLPDLYDRDNTSEGLGQWCLMASGSYGGDGSHENTPSHMSAWCKEKLGWVTPVIVNSYVPQKTIRCVERYPEVYKLYYRGGSSGQYFLVENRQNLLFDKYLSNSGLCIYHVDPSVTSQNDNENRYLVDLEQADGRRDLNLGKNRSDAGDPYPGISNNRAYDGYTYPNSQDYALNQSYIGVRRISNSDTVMTADFDLGTRPYFYINALSLSEVAPSNSNSRLDPGETGTVLISTLNGYPAAASDARITLTSLSSDLEIDTTTRVVNAAGLESRIDTLRSYVKVKSGAKLQPAVFTVNIATTEEVFKRSFSVMLGYPNVLVVDLDSLSSDSASRMYTRAIANYGESFEEVSPRTQTMQNMAPTYRTAMMIFTGRKTFETIPETLAATLTAFLDKGGNLLLSGQNIAEDMTARNSSMKNDLLKASWVKNVSVLGRVAFGIPGDPIGSQIAKISVTGGNGVSNQTSPDELSVDTLNAHPIFRWGSASGTNFGGLWWENTSKKSKVVFFSFGFEGINDLITGANSRDQVMTAVMNWFTGKTAVPDFDRLQATPNQFSLADNYPNPFNPSTVIGYAVPTSAHVSLCVYDMLGRLVHTLVDEKREAGYYSVLWDATNITRSHVASGTYFYRLEAGGFVITKRMVLVR